MLKKRGVICLVATTLNFYKVLRQNWTVVKYNQVTFNVGTAQYQFFAVINNVLNLKNIVKI